MCQSYHLYADDILVLAISSTLIYQHTVSVYIHVLLLLVILYSPLVHGSDTQIHPEWQTQPDTKSTIIRCNITSVVIFQNKTLCCKLLCINAAVQITRSCQWWLKIRTKLPLKCSFHGEQRLGMPCHACPQQNGPWCIWLWFRNYIKIFSDFIQKLNLSKLIENHISVY